MSLSLLVCKAEQLLGNVTTNLAESWMNVRTKFDGGKVVNRSQSGSWEHRCMGAGLRQNIGRDWSPQAWRQVTNSSPNKVFVNKATHSAMVSSSDRKRKATTKVKEKRRRSKYARTGNETIAARKAYNRHDGGSCFDEIIDEVSPQVLEDCKKSFFQANVSVTQEEAQDIERAHKANQRMNTGKVREGRD